MEQRLVNGSPGKRLVRTALRDSVYDTLLDMLLDGSLPPGASVSIDGVARQLEVSPTPVREALVHLERTGLVSREALRGYRVSPPLNADQISELCQARLVLEVSAMDFEFDDLDALVPELVVAHAAHVAAAERLEEVYARGRTDLLAARRYFEADWEFHTTLIRHSHNRYLKAMSEQLFPHVHRLRQTVRHGISDATVSVGEHAAILASVEAGDQQRAKAAMATHLRNVLARSVADVGVETPTRSR